MNAVSGRRAGLSAETDEWIASIAVLFSDEGRARINRIHDLLKVTATEQHVTVSWYVASEFMTLMTQVRNEAPRISRGVESVAAALNERFPDGVPS